jgi:hypothetical protein
VGQQRAVDAVARQEPEQVLVGRVIRKLLDFVLELGVCLEGLLEARLQLAVIMTERPPRQWKQRQQKQDVQVSSDAGASTSGWSGMGMIRGLRCATPRGVARRRSVGSV